MSAEWPGIAQEALDGWKDQARGALAATIDHVGSNGEVATERLYLPLSAWIAHRTRAFDGVPIVGIQGGQGSGKSTLAAAVETLLGSLHGLKAVRLSIDDLYLTRAERERLGRITHPQLAVRGVPGTHDLPLGFETLRALRESRPGAATRLPRFDKSRDDRAAPSHWAHVVGAVDVVLFEGWCVGLPPEPEEALRLPINAFEAAFDPDGALRRYANRQLATGYAELFRSLDFLVVLAVPSMERVRAWRWQQEVELRARHAHAHADRRALMSAAEVEGFVDRFERLTAHGVRVLPSRADVSVRLGDDHGPRSITVSRP